MIELKNYSNDFFDFLLEANNINAPEVGFVDKNRLQLLIDQSNYCKIVFYDSIPAGFLLCLPENIQYDSMNYAWISERYKNFMYIDRISIVKEFQSKKLGTALYNDLIKCSKEENYDIILCEVNIYPPNPGSITFHKRFDFIECGSQFTEAGKKQVQFFFREL